MVGSKAPLRRRSRTRPRYLHCSVTRRYDYLISYDSVFSTLDRTDASFAARWGSRSRLAKGRLPTQDHTRQYSTSREGATHNDLWMVPPGRDCGARQRPGKAHVLFVQMCFEGHTLGHPDTYLNIWSSTHSHISFCPVSIVRRVAVFSRGRAERAAALPRSHCPASPSYYNRSEKRRRARTLCCLLRSNHRIAVPIESAHNEPLVEGDEEGPALDLASDEPASGFRIFTDDKPRHEQMWAPRGGVNVPLLERCVKAGHRTLSGEDQPVEECEALHPHGAIGQVRETRRHTPAIEGRLSRRRAVPPLCKRKALCGTAAWERRVKLKAQGGEEKLREAGRVEHLVMGFG